MALISRLSQELFEYEREETSGEILFFKIFELYIVLSVIHLAWAWGLYVMRISDVVLPLGIANYIDVSIFFGNGASLVVAGLITIFAVLGYFRVNKYMYLAAFLLLHLQYATRFSLGEIAHSANLIAMTLLGLGTAMVLFSDAKKRRRFAMGYTYFFVGLVYTSAGISKLAGTGVFWSDGRHMWLWVHEKAVDAMGYTGLLDYSMLQELVLNSMGIATIILTVGLLIELFAWLTWIRKYRLITIQAIIALHVGIYFVMNILFWHSILELSFLALPWAKWLDTYLSSRKPIEVPRFMYG